MARVIKGSGGPPGGKRPAKRSGGPRRVLEKEVYKAKQEAEEIKRQAEQKREELVTAGKRKAAQLREEAQVEGAAEAFAEAAAEALTAFRRRAERYAEAADDVRHLALEVVRKVLGRSPALSERAVEVIVEQGMNRLRARRKLRLLLPPERVEALSRERPALLDALHREPDLVLEGTDDVSSGYCRVVTEVGGALCSEQAALDSLTEALEIDESAVAPRPRSRLDQLGEDDEHTQALPGLEPTGTDGQRDGAYGGVRLSVTAPDTGLQRPDAIQIDAGLRARPLPTADPNATQALDISELRGRLAKSSANKSAVDQSAEEYEEYEEDDEEFEDDDDLDLFADDSLPDR